MENDILVKMIDEEIKVDPKANAKRASLSKREVNQLKAWSMKTLEFECGMNYQRLQYELILMKQYKEHRI